MQDPDKQKQPGIHRIFWVNSRPEREFPPIWVVKSKGIRAPKWPKHSRRIMTFWTIQTIHLLFCIELCQILTFNVLFSLGLLIGCFLHLYPSIHLCNSPLKPNFQTDPPLDFNGHSLVFSYFKMARHVSAQLHQWNLEGDPNTCWGLVFSVGKNGVQISLKTYRKVFASENFRENQDGYPK